MTAKEIGAIAGIVLGGGGGLSGYTFLQDYWSLQAEVVSLGKAVATIREELNGELSATRVVEAKAAYRIQLCLDGALPEDQCKGLGVYMPEKSGPTTIFMGGHRAEDGKWRPEHQAHPEED